MTRKCYIECEYRTAVYTRPASAAVSLVDASGVVTPAIMACRNVLHDGGEVSTSMHASTNPRNEKLVYQSILRVPTRLDQHEEAESPSSNAWPTGLRTMGCLGCDAPFVSSGRHERLCALCRRRKP